MAKKRKKTTRRSQSESVHYHTGKFPPKKLDWAALVPLIGPANAALARYDALEVNDSAVQVLGDETLKLIAQELIDEASQEAERERSINKWPVIRLYMHLSSRYCPADERIRRITTGFLGV